MKNKGASNIVNKFDKSIRQKYPNYLNDNNSESSQDLDLNLPVTTNLVKYIPSSSENGQLSAIADVKNTVTMMMMMIITTIFKRRNKNKNKLMIKNYHQHRWQFKIDDSRMILKTFCKE